MSYSVKEMLENKFGELKNDLTEFKEHLTEIKSDVKEVNEKVGFQNGRVRKLEDWSNEAKALIESNGEILSTYKGDKIRIWTAMSIILILGGTIITLSISVINSKMKERIKEGIDTALAEFDIKVIK